MPRRLPISPFERLIREAAESIAHQATDILKNSITIAVDDALERVERKGEEVLGRVRHARTVAQGRSRRGRRT